jgi:hypothetical protein
MITWIFTFELSAISDNILVKRYMKKKNSSILVKLRRPGISMIKPVQISKTSTKEAARLYFLFFSIESATRKNTPEKQAG